MVIFDPQRELFKAGGIRINIINDYDQYENYLLAFDHYLDYPCTMPFCGTVIRLPLHDHSKESHISSEVHDVDTVRRLLLSFVESELNVTMLFLSNIKSIEIREIDDQGERLLGMAEITRDQPSKRSTLNESEPHIYTRSVKTRHSGAESDFLEEDWRILRETFSTQLRNEAVAKQFSGSRDDDWVNDVLNSEKLHALIALAFPLPLRGSETHGRLFTFLPLPLQPGFPCHTHALFALTDSRQNLINPSESSILEKTREE